MMHSGMMWDMGLTWLLILAFWSCLAIAALANYVFFGKLNMPRLNVLCAATLALAVLSAIGSAAAQPSNAGRGEQAFRACAVCHSLMPDKNMTGPSLAGLFGRKAGTLPSFDRYSPALKLSGITWDAKSLDAWLADPAKLVPGNHMTFPGIKDVRTRDDLIAFLQKATAPGAAPPSMAQPGGRMGGMGGMMGGGQVQNLKQETPAQHVTAIRYCRDSYYVTTADGDKHDFWERNLRLMTDSSAEGPPKGSPALVPAGMMGDRADVIFADPTEINRTIELRCE